mgnify:FL=1
MKPSILPIRPMYPNCCIMEFCTTEQAEKYRNAKDMNDYWRERKNEHT